MIPGILSMLTRLLSRALPSMPGSRFLSLPRLSSTPSIFKIYIPHDEGRWDRLLKVVLNNNNNKKTPQTGLWSVRVCTLPSVSFLQAAVGSETTSCQAGGAAACKAKPAGFGGCRLNLGKLSCLFSSTDALLSYVTVSVVGSLRKLMLGCSQWKGIGGEKGTVPGSNYAE